MTIHISLDLETWGKRPGCDLRSIGACVFDPHNVVNALNDGKPVQSNGSISGPNKGGQFYIATDNPQVGRGTVNSGIHERYEPKYPLARDPETVQWWNDQSDEAQAAFADPVDLREALISFGEWFQSTTPMILEPGGINDGRNVCIWSHGAAFDPPILAAAYEAVGLPVPWHYRAPRDTRTAFDMAGITDHSAHLDRFAIGTHHHALDDAICQARAVCDAFATVKGWADAMLTTKPPPVTITDPKTLTPAENHIRDLVLEQAASICEGVTSWGLPPTKLEVAQSTQRFCARAIRAQKSDSPQRIAHENDAIDTTETID